MLRRILGALSCSALLASVAHAQEGGLARTRVEEFVGDVARAHLGRPLELQRLSEPPAGVRPARLLAEGLALELRAFERDSDGPATLGLGYGLRKLLEASEEPELPALEFVSHGQVAFESEANPHDLLVTHLRLHWGGTRPLGRGPGRLERAESLPNPEGSALAGLAQGDFSRLSEEFGNATSSAEVEASPTFHALTQVYFDALESDLGPELLWDFELHGGLETTQELSRRQVVFGTSLGGQVVSWDPDSRLSRWNLFDFPAAAVRWLAGQDFRPSGRAYPSLVAGLDVVDASADDRRGRLTDEESLLRLKLEACMSSPIVSTDVGALSLSAAWRFHVELSAPAAVRRSGEDDASFLELRLGLPKGWSLRYATGELPLDPQTDSVFAFGYELGW